MSIFVFCISIAFTVWFNIINDIPWWGCFITGFMFAAAFDNFHSLVK